MKQEIKILDIFGTELYTRSRAAELRQYIKDDASEVVINMKGVTFISRSFADEICNIVDDIKDKKIILTEQSEEVGIMITKVAENRAVERKRGIANAKIFEFKDMESLSSFLLTM